MKANEPEKIYMSPAGVLYKGDKQQCNDIEYTRTDAFIEKACEWLKESITNNPECNRIISKKGAITMGLLIEDFKNYMEGE
jgi:hypothetical protein